VTSCPGFSCKPNPFPDVMINTPNIRESSLERFMEIVRFDDPPAYQAHVQGYLVRREAENNLFPGVLAGLIAGEYIK